MDSHDPTSGVKNKHGVAAWVDYGNATGFFDRLNVSCKCRQGIPIGWNCCINRLLDAASGFAHTPRKYFDFSTGQTLTEYTSPTQEDISAAWLRYINASKPYEDLHVPNYFDFR